MRAGCVLNGMADVRMLETSARLLRLLGFLQARRYWSGFELADRLEVTGRTLRRDVNRYATSVLPSSRVQARQGGYHLGRGSALPPLLLEDDESVAVGISLPTACASAVTGMESAGLTALDKFEHFDDRDRMSRSRDPVVQVHDSIGNRRGSACGVASVIHTALAGTWRHGTSCARTGARVVLHATHAVVLERFPPCLACWNP